MLQDPKTPKTDLYEQKQPMLISLRLRNPSLPSIGEGFPISDLNLNMIAIPWWVLIFPNDPF